MGGIARGLGLGHMTSLAGEGGGGPCQFLHYIAESQYWTQTYSDLPDELPAEVFLMTTLAPPISILSSNLFC